MSVWSAALLHFHCRQLAAGTLLMRLENLFSEGSSCSFIGNDATHANFVSAGGSSLDSFSWCSFADSFLLNLRIRRDARLTSLESAGPVGACAKEDSKQELSALLGFMTIFSFQRGKLNTLLKAWFICFTHCCPQNLQRTSQFCSGWFRSQYKFSSLICLSQIMQ